MGLNGDGGRPSNEDKRYWCEEGLKRERWFVDKVAPFLGIEAEINPAKQHDIYAPDLLVNGEVADLKCQWTPFFRAYDLYGITPQYAVTFNKNDYDRYGKEYPEIDIYVWLRWKHETDKLVGPNRYIVAPMRGVWRASLADLQEIVEGDAAPLHAYEKRRDDTKGNAKQSYLFDVREFEELAIYWP